MKKTFKRFAVFFFCLAFLSVNSQNVNLINGESSDTGDHEEQIGLEIRPYDGWVGLAFIFRNVSGPLDISDFASEPNFTSITIGGTYTPEDERTVVMVTLNTQDKSKADILKAKVENFFEITLPYSGNFDFTYVYRIDECPVIQKFRDIFLEHKPSQGFGKIVTPSLIGNYVAIAFDLKRNGDLLEWWVTATVNFPEYFEMNLGQEYTIGLKELTGYSEAIQSSPESSNSALNILIAQVDEEYKLISLEAEPSQMERRQGTYGAVTTFSFDGTITGSSVDDLSIHFKIVSPNYIDPTTIYMIVGVVVITLAILSIVVFTIRKKR